MTTGRICFVIMPFSSTESCSKEEWDRIFSRILRPAIEEAGLGYECRRSEATRGNIIAAIMQDLRSAHVVLADLTDRNANVFYELGVRHALTDRTLLLAQNGADIPFDLRPYAFHVYDWRSEEGIDELTRTIRGLLADIDATPHRPDNPVSDFLKRTSVPVAELEAPVAVAAELAPLAQSLVGPEADGLDAAGLARRLEASNAAGALNTVRRLTTQALPAAATHLAEELGSRPVPETVRGKETLAVGTEMAAAAQEAVVHVDSFTWTCAELDWAAGVRMAMRLAGNLVSLSEVPTVAANRFVAGVPSLLAWRQLMIAGAVGVSNDSFDVLRVLIKEPIEVQSGPSGFTNQPLPLRRDLFFPESFLGHGDFGALYLYGLWDRSPTLRHFFADEAEYLLRLTGFQLLIALADADGPEDTPLYASYRLNRSAAAAMNLLVDRLAASRESLRRIASVLDESDVEFKQNWQQRAEKANSGGLGHRYVGYRVRFPLEWGDARREA